MKFDESHTLIDVLQQRAEQNPAFPLYTFLKDGEKDETTLSLHELDALSCAIAQQLTHVAQKGDRALLLYPPGLAFVAAFFGCLYAGVLAVPAYPPRRNKPDERLLSIVQDAQPTVVLTTAHICSELSLRAAEIPQLQKLNWLATDTLSNGEQYERPNIQIYPADLAFLQYTSGSTGQPKGVMISHGNLLHNERMIAEGFGHNRETIVAGWLPVFHDMGLVGNLLQPLYLGCPVVLLSPISFLQSPIRWLQMICQYRATTSGGPNFAYDLCVEKIGKEQREGLDLSSWTVAFNGAEPIRAVTLDRFVDAFSPYGFRWDAFYPCYGMAESSLFITGANPAKAPITKRIDATALEARQVVSATCDAEKQQILVSSGRKWLDSQICIVNPETLQRCAPDEVGEIWVSSPSVAQGYWGQDERTQETFAATIAEGNEGKFLRTGDLGFLSDGELYVSGRLKDLIIIRGRNYYPQDIEETVAGCHAELRVGGGAVFSIESGTKEYLTVVQEVERSAMHSLNVDAIYREIRLAVADRYQLQVNGIQLLRPMSIPKTSSGKIQRHACKVGYLKSTLNVVGDWKNADTDLVIRNQDS